MKDVSGLTAFSRLEENFFLWHLTEPAQFSWGQRWLSVIVPRGRGQVEESCRDLSRPFLGMLQSPHRQAASVYKCPNHWFGDLAKSKVKEEHQEPGGAPGAG